MLAYIRVPLSRVYALCSQIAWPVPTSDIIHAVGHDAARSWYSHIRKRGNKTSVVTWRICSHEISLGHLRSLTVFCFVSSHTRDLRYMPLVWECLEVLFFRWLLQIVTISTIPYGRLLSPGCTVNWLVNQMSQKILKYHAQ